MPKQRAVDDPWYTVLYRDPHTHWWASGLILFPILFLVIYFLGEDSAIQAGLVSAAIAVASTAGAFFRHRLRRR